MSDLTIILFAIGLTLLSVGLVGKWLQHRNGHADLVGGGDE